MIGDDALFPPTVTQAPANRTFTPVSGSATADTSATVRFAQPASVCQDGLGSKALQPLPAPDHADSVQPRAVDVARVSDVPPTAVRRTRTSTATSTPPTSRMWQFGQTALTMSRSSEISSAQSGLGAGGSALPLCLPLRKHPRAAVHGGRP